MYNVTGQENQSQGSIGVKPGYLWAVVFVIIALIVATLVVCYYVKKGKETKAAKELDVTKEMELQARIARAIGPTTPSLA
jgi:hypothetical protein